MIEPGKDFIPLNASGFDSHLCYATARPLMTPPKSKTRSIGDTGSGIDPDVARVYYSGTNGPHDGNNKSSFIGLATIHPQRFAGVAANVSNTATTLHTVPIRCSGSKLLLTADVDSASVVDVSVTRRGGVGGSVKVGVVGVVGMQLSDAVAVTSNVTNVAVGFKGGLDFTALIGKEVVITMELVDSVVYQVQWSS